MTVFGHRGNLSFTAIGQAWLRAAAKAWASHDLPRRRGTYGADKTRQPARQPGAAVASRCGTAPTTARPGRARARRHRSVPAPD